MALGLWRVESSLLPIAGGRRLTSLGLGRGGLELGYEPVLLPREALAHGFVCFGPRRQFLLVAVVCRHSLGVLFGGVALVDELRIPPGCFSNAEGLPKIGLPSRLTADPWHGFRHPIVAMLAFVVVVLGIARLLLCLLVGLYRRYGLGCRGIPQLPVEVQP